MYMNTRFSRYTFIPENLIDEFKHLHAQSGNLNNLTKNPPNLRYYRQLKTLMDVVQKFTGLVINRYSL